jgi:hypothetical protein
MNFHKEIDEAGGLYFLTALKIKAKRESYPAQLAKWLVPVKEHHAPRPVAPRPEPESWKVTPLERKPLLVTADAVDEQDQELEAYLEPDPVEVCAAPKPIEAGDDTDVDVMDDEGGGQLTFVTDDES